MGLTSGDQLLRGWSEDITVHPNSLGGMVEESPALLTCTQLRVRPGRRPNSLAKQVDSPAVIITFNKVWVRGKSDPVVSLVVWLLPFMELLSRPGTAECSK